MQLYSNTRVGTVQSANLHVNATNTYNILFNVQLLHVQNRLFGVQQRLLVPQRQHMMKPLEEVKDMVAGSHYQAL